MHSSLFRTTESKNDSNKLPGIRFLKPAPANLLEIALNHHGIFSALDGANLILNKTMSQYLQPEMTRHKLLHYVHEALIFEAATLLDSTHELEKLLLRKAEKRNFFGRIIKQTVLQTALRNRDAGMIQLLKNYITKLPNGVQIIANEEEEYQAYLVQQEAKIICDDGVERNKHERDTRAFSKLLENLQQVTSPDDPQLATAFETFRKYLYLADKNDEPFNPQLLIHAFNEFRLHFVALGQSGKYINKKLFEEGIGAIEACAPPIFKKCLAQGVYFFIINPDLTVDRNKVITSCGWDSEGRLHSNLPKDTIGLDCAFDDIGQVTCTRLKDPSRNQLRPLNLVLFYPITTFVHQMHLITSREFAAALTTQPALQP